MSFLTRADKELFLRYAIPCGHVLVKRGELKARSLSVLESKLIRGRSIPESEIRKTFKVAYAMCLLIAKGMGKKNIDRQVVRRYFWKEHTKAIKWRSKIYPDVTMAECRVYRGRVLSIGKKAVVLVSRKKKSLKKDFVPDLKKGDRVITHYDYVVEKIGR